MSTTKRVMIRGGAKVDRFFNAIDAKLEDAEDDADVQTKKLMDNALRKAVARVLSSGGRMARETLKPAYMPKKMCALMDHMFDKMWPQIAKNLEEGIMLSSSYEGDKLRETRLLWWAKAPLFWGHGEPWRSWPQPYTWLRAKLLYAIKPADANKFKHLGDPAALFLVLMKLNTYMGINVIFFVVLFLLMDRDDEGQIVDFVLSFKSYQFLSALFMVPRPRCARAAPAPRPPSLGPALAGARAHAPSLAHSLGPALAHTHPSLLCSAAPARPWSRASGRPRLLASL